MQQKNGKLEFVALLTFLIAATLVLTNGFSARISADRQSKTDVYEKIHPIGKAMGVVLEEYVKDADLDKIVEGALYGMMSSLDRNSSFISTEDLRAMREDTKGEFEGIGVQIKLDDDGNVIVFQPVPGSPASKAGIMPSDIIIKIDGIALEDMWTDGMTPNDKLSKAASKIKGPRGTVVKITVLRPGAGGDGAVLDFNVKRDKVDLESIKEARILDGKIGYIRISDFKDNTARDLRNRVKELLDGGMTSFILDLRWNPGGLLTSAKQVAELFLPKGTLVVYTKGRPLPDGRPSPEDMQLYTEEKPVLPPDFPMVILVNEISASSSEIVTGALQFHQRALVVGTKTYGKGSVQTIIPLEQPPSTALRLTTALYYTPADVTIDHQGILPDIEVPMSREHWQFLRMQMSRSYENDPAKVNEQNHGSVTGNEITRQPLTEEQTQKLQEAIQLIQENFGTVSFDKMPDQTVEDDQLKRAVEILREDSVWQNLIDKYHRDVHETQVAAERTTIDEDLERGTGGVESPDEDADSEL